MDALEYDRLFKEIPEDYTLAQLKYFIHEIRAERRKLKKQIDEYKVGIKPTYINEGGRWYNGLCKRVHILDAKDLEVSKIYRAKRDYPNGKCGTGTQCEMMSKQVLNKDWVFCPYCGSKLERANAK